MNEYTVCIYKGCKSEIRKLFGTPVHFNQWTKDIQKEHGFTSWNLCSRISLPARPF